VDLYEYQAKELFRHAGVPVPDGRVAQTPEEAAAIAAELGGRVVVKAQVRVGGRGKAGGIKVVEGAQAAREAASRILGTDIKGHLVRRVLVERASDVVAEYYLAILHDRGSKGFLAMASTQGGMDIEEVAARDPRAIARVAINPLIGLQPFHVRDLVYGAGFDPQTVGAASRIATTLYGMFVSVDCMLVEVNPLVLTADGGMLALDAKVSLDESALFRHPDLDVMRETYAQDPQERTAKEKGLSYIKLDGDIGIIGNGAGLVMSTLDLVSQAGGKAANFLDVGGGASSKVIADSLEIVLSDPRVRGVLVNIFGGITRCDQVAEGILVALGRLGKVKAPIVVRLDGTNAEQGRRILSEAGIKGVVPAATMMEAAAKSVDLVGSA